MDFERFVKSQNLLYSVISEEINDVKKLGLEPRPSIMTGEHGVMLALGYNPLVSEAINRISTKINEFVPSVIYSPENIHTTIVSSPINNDLEIESYKTVFTKILNRLASFSEHSVSVMLRDFLITRESVIIKGLADTSLYELTDEVVKQGLSYGLELKYPKMTHISIARFTEKRSQDEIEGLIEYVKSLEPIGKTVLDRVYVGEFNNSSKGISVDVLESVAL